MGIPSRLAIYKGVQMPQGGGGRELRAAAKLRRPAPGREGSYRPVPATPDAKRHTRRLHPGDVRDELEQLPDAVGLLHRVPEKLVAADLVVIPAPNPGSGHVTVSHQVGHDGLGSPLGDPHPGGDVTPPDSGVASDAHQHVPVVGQERPPRPSRLTIVSHESRLAQHRHGRNRESMVIWDSQTHACVAAPDIPSAISERGKCHEPRSPEGGSPVQPMAALGRRRGPVPRPGGATAPV